MFSQKETGGINSKDQTNPFSDQDLVLQHETLNSVSQELSNPYSRDHTYQNTGLPQGLPITQTDKDDLRKSIGQLTYKNSESNNMTGCINLKD